MAALKEMSKLEEDEDDEEDVLVEEEAYSWNEITMLFVVFFAENCIVLLADEVSLLCGSIWFGYLAKRILLFLQLMILLYSLLKTNHITTQVYQRNIYVTTSIKK